MTSSHMALGTRGEAWAPGQFHTNRPRAQGAAYANSSARCALRFHKLAFLRGLPQKIVSGRVQHASDIIVRIVSEIGCGVRIILGHDPLLLESIIALTLFRLHSQRESNNAKTKKAARPKRVPAPEANRGHRNWPID
jgi:hypothetical protein